MSTPSLVRRRLSRTQITRVCGDRDRSLLFRGWSRLCLAAASLNAAEGAAAAATAAARAARADAMEKEAAATAAAAEQMEAENLVRRQTRALVTVSDNMGTYCKCCLLRERRDRQGFVSMAKSVSSVSYKYFIPVQLV